MMRHLVILCCVICWTTGVMNGTPMRTPRLKYNFNQGWRVFVGDPAGAKGLSFDDNETTEWVSNGRLADSWIKYEFAHSERISEVRSNKGQAIRTYF